MIKEDDYRLFVDRKIKAKSIFKIKNISKLESYNFVRKYHYLKDAKFFCCEAYGLFYQDELVGVATYAQPQGISSLKGWFGLDNENKDIYELTRLCLLPELNGTNATSFLLGGSMKMLKGRIRAVITLADSNRHVGSIYQICNFRYYGLTDKKTDFFSIDGKINPRGQTKNKDGVWLNRTRKHRYCYILDKSLEVKYKEVERPKNCDVFRLECCNGTNEVYDNRFSCWYTCPRCTGKLVKKDVKKVQG